MLASEVTALVATLVGTAISMVALWAAFRFHADSMSMSDVKERIISISNRVDFLNSTVSQIADKTLDSAIAKSDTIKQLGDLFHTAKQIQEVNSPSLLESTEVDTKYINDERKQNVILLNELRDQIENLKREINGDDYYDHEVYVDFMIDNCIISTLKEFEPISLFMLGSRASDRIFEESNYQLRINERSLHGNIFRLWVDEYIFLDGSKYVSSLPSQEG